MKWKHFFKALSSLFGLLWSTLIWFLTVLIVHGSVVISEPNKAVAMFEAYMLMPMVFFTTLLGFYFLLKEKRGAN